MKSLRLTVHGRVQGVGFRYYVKTVGDRLDLVGRVKNNPDDSVGILVEGEEKLVNEFLEYCKKGPAAAKVDKIDVSEEKSSKKFKSFEIIF